MKAIHLTTAVSLLAFAAVAWADTLTVTTIDDNVPGSLRQTVADANPGDTIDFAVTGNIDLVHGTLTISKDLTITGPGPASLSLRYGGEHVVQVTAGHVQISGVTIRDALTDQDGGGMRVEAGATVSLRDCVFTFNSIIGYRGQPQNAHTGGAISNAGTLDVADCTFDRNKSWGADFNAFAQNEDGLGAGLFNARGATATIARSLFVQNSARGSNTGMSLAGSAAGGAIYNLGTLTLTNVTITGNLATAGGGPDPGSGGSASGAGIYNAGTLHVTSCTLTDNEVGAYLIAQGDGIYSTYGTATVESSIAAGNTRVSADTTSPDDCYGAFASTGHNLIGVDTDSTGFADGVGGDIVGTAASPVEPLLAPLADNGGPTETHALLPSSPAIDAGASDTCPATDQRGVARPIDGNADGVAVCDIGAYEAPVGTGLTPTPTSATPTPSTATPTPSATATATCACPTYTNTPIYSFTPTPPASPSASPASTATGTASPTLEPTNTPTSSFTPTPATPAASVTEPPFRTDTPTETPTNIRPTSTATRTSTASSGGGSCSIARSASHKRGGWWTLFGLLALVLVRFRRGVSAGR